MENIWFIADTHFNHQSILKHCNRPFANIEEMNEKIIENWNSVINKHDRVYIIGDFAFSNHAKFADKLKGKKHLIKGNHDEMSQECYSRFESVSQIKEIFINKKMFVLCHFPLRTWSECHHGSINLFGHCHGREQTNNLSFDIGVDTNNFMPYSYENIMNMVEKREEEMKRVHRIILNKDNKKHPLQYFQDDVQYWQFIYKKASEKK
jgi:calcineurin-like phosphoesterase family protein